MKYIHLPCIFLAAAFSILPITEAFTQGVRDTSVVQLSGLVVEEVHGSFMPVPYVNIYFKGTDRGTWSGEDGFFSIVGRKGETVVFSSIGYKTVEYPIPDTLKGNRFSIFQLLTKDTVLLPETVIYPWPSREHFKVEFLAMDITNELEERAQENLSERVLAQLLENLPADGNTSADLYLRQQANSYYYEGQIKPITLLNPMAWVEFIQALKRGDFKKKKK